MYISAESRKSGSQYIHGLVLIAFQADIADIDTWARESKNAENEGGRSGPMGFGTGENMHSSADDGILPHGGSSACVGQGTLNLANGFTCNACLTLHFD